MNKNILCKLIIVALVPIIVWNIKAPDGLDADTWHIVAIYLALLAGLVIKPFNEPITTLIILGMGSMFIKSSVLLNGYSNSITWFILVVTVVCTAFVKTGLGKRIAYNLLLRSGKSTLGLGYLLMTTDLILSPATGSNSARTTIVYPIFKNIAEGVGSYPDNNPRKLGAYLTILMYVVSQSTSALFLTGMATNAITASLAKEMINIDLTWGIWFMASAVPGGIVLLLSPYIVYKVYKPELTELGDIKIVAQKGLAEMGPMDIKEKMLGVIFVLAILGWVFGTKVPFVDLNMQVVGFVFLAVVLVTGILDWDDVMGAKAAWNLFIWYGAFLGVAASLASAGFYTWFANTLGHALNITELNGLLVLVVLVFISLGVRYFFVSNSAFVASFYPVLFAVTLTTKANMMVAVLMLAYFSSYGALLTHYGNGAGLIVYASGYAPPKDFWRVGTIMVFVALLVFFFIGLPYWKLIGLW